MKTEIGMIIKQNAKSMCRLENVISAEVFNIVAVYIRKDKDIGADIKMFSRLPRFVPIERLAASADIEVKTIDEITNIKYCITNAVRGTLYNKR